jgi:hypothetical protein
VIAAASIQSPTPASPTREPSVPGRSRDRRRRRTTSIAAALSAALLVVQFSSQPVNAADGPKTRSDHLRERADRDAANEAYWRGEHQKLLKRQEKAELDVERASEANTRARRRRRIRGGPSETTLKTLNEAREELKNANSALAKFYDDAPRAGAEPGWLRPKD